MIDDPEIKAEHGIKSSVLAAFYTWCFTVDEVLNNEGTYRATFFVNSETLLLKKTIPVALRRGIVYYSKRHGWRVRENPHWKTVFAERFPIHYARFTYHEEK